MLFRQLYNSVSSTYSYLIASRRGGEALIIDPVLERVDRYLQLMRELDLRLVKAVDTHIHADHITGLGELRDRTQCITIMGEHSGVDVVSMRVADGDRVDIEGVSLGVMYTPGHTAIPTASAWTTGCSPATPCSFAARGGPISRMAMHGHSTKSIFGRLLKLPDEMLVYPAHDYKGDMVSTIAEERAFNPRLQVKSVDEYVDMMNSLKLPNPKMMDVAVPANLHIGLSQDDIARLGWAMTAEQALSLVGKPETVFVDLREERERDKLGAIQARSMRPILSLAASLRAAACSTNSRPRPASGSSFTALSANARRWRSRPPKRPASPTPAMCMAAWTPGASRTAPWPDRH